MAQTLAQTSNNCGAIYPVDFKRNLIFGEGFRFLHCSIMKVLQPTVLLSFLSARILLLRENFLNNNVNFWALAKD